MPRSGAPGPARRIAWRQWRRAGLAIVFLILCLALIGPRTDVGFRRVKPEIAERQARTLRAALDTMREDIGRYPSAEEGLVLLVRPPRDDATRRNWHGPYIEGRLPHDPWGRPFHYSPRGKPPNPIALYSGGEFGLPSGEVIGFPPSD